MRFYLQVSSLLQIPDAVSSRGCRERGGSAGAEQRCSLATARGALPRKVIPPPRVPAGAPRVPFGPTPPSLRLCLALPTPTQVEAPQGRPGGVSTAGLLRPLLLPAAPHPPARWWEKGEPEPGAPILPNQWGRWATFKSQKEQPTPSGTSRFALGRSLSER